jgi:hypothetical protein
MSDKPFGKKPPAAPLADEWSTVRKTDLVGIVRDDSVLFDRGYWMRYDGAPRPDEPGEVQDGWDACDWELEAGDAAWPPAL